MFIFIRKIRITHSFIICSHIDGIIKGATISKNNSQNLGKYVATITSRNKRSPFYLNYFRIFWILARFDIKSLPESIYQLNLIIIIIQFHFH